MKEKKTYLVSFLLLIFFAVNGLYCPMTIRIIIFRFFGKRWLDVVLIQVM